MALFINEFHYDNSGADVGEFVEVAGTAGTNAAGYRLLLYNGQGGDVYAVMEGGERSLGVAVGVMHQLVVGHVDVPGIVVDLNAALQLD